MFGLGFQEMMVLLLLGVLLFGRKLPDIGRSIGKTVVEFKKGMKGVEDELSSDTSSRPAIEPEPVRPPQRVTTASAPKFDDAPAANMPPRV
ncbi:MAG TPA: twin-arginine translocase TatA/TatE family subunit [Fimbriiglobus sp.]|jgi:sec-independent protein translocase protein TatA